MPRFLLLASILCLGASVLSCSSGDAATEDTCAFAKDQTNCWRTVAAQVQGCVESTQDNETGTLSTDGTRCDYASGLHIVFDPPIKIGIQPTALQATLYKQLVVKCATVSVDRLTETLSITTAAGEMLVQTTDQESHEATLTCPSGTRHTIRGEAVMDECFTEAMGGGVPGVKVEHTGMTASLGLSGYAGVLYSCK